MLRGSFTRLVALLWVCVGAAAPLGAQCMQWVEQTVSNPPPASSSIYRAQMVYDKAIHKAVLLIDYHPDHPQRVLVYSLGPSSWTLFDPSAPAPHNVASACYHEQRGTVLVWTDTGNELWEWNGAAWSRILHGGPWPSAAGFLRYDPIRQRAILVSGTTWEWTGSAWEQGPSTPPMGADSAVFDVHRNRVFLWGLDSSSAYEAYWEYVPGASAAQGSWTRVQEGVPYVWLPGGSLVYDTFRREIVEHGGVIFGGPTYGTATSKWNLDWLHAPSWTNLPDVGSVVHFPAEKARAYSAKCFDADTGNVILFGGQSHVFIPNVGAEWTFYNDTWVLQRNEPGIVVDLSPTAHWCAGQPGILAISTAGTVDRQWYKDGQPIPGATSSILSVNPVTPASAGVYDCLVDNTCGGIWSRPCTVSVDVAPAITSPPIGDAVCPYQTVRIVGPGMTGTSLNVELQVLTGQGWVNQPYTYNPLGNFYEIPSAQPEHTGTYRFRVSNGCGEAYSATCHVQVGVTITASPQSLNRQPCDTATFTAAGVGVGQLGYYWVRGMTPLVDDGRISGTRTATLTINGVRFSDEGEYRCNVVDACGFLAASNAATLSLPQPSWAHITSSGPARRVPVYTDMVYDASRGVCVLYGGSAAVTPTSMSWVNDTWEWDGVEWTRRNPPHNPGLRAGHQMVYDSVRGKVLLYGGYTPSTPFGDATVWQYDGTDWVLLTTSPGGPPPLQSYEGDAVFDQARGKMVLLAINQGGTYPSNQTWEFDPVTLVWQRTYLGTSILYNASPLVYDPVTGTVLACALQNFAYAAPWQYTGSGWQQIGPVGPARYMPVVAFDALRQRVTLFGNARNELNYPNFHNDTFALIGNSWTQVLPEFEPVAANRLWPAGMVFDTRRNAMLTVGSTYNDYTGLNPMDTWEYRYLDGVVFDRQPQSQTLTSGATTRLGVKAAGWGTLAFQWRKGGVALADGPTGGGSVISGSQTDTLTITNTAATDAGSYTCAVTGPCETAVSAAASLTCYANCDGSTTPPALNIQDFACFLNRFANADPYANCDGSTVPPVLNVQDFACFLNSFAVGCP